MKRLPAGTLQALNPRTTLCVDRSEACGPILAGRTHNLYLACRYWPIYRLTGQGPENGRMRVWPAGYSLW